jgi:phage gp36-like protein
MRKPGLPGFAAQNASHPIASKVLIHGSEPSMSVQTYCTHADLEAAWTSAALLAAVDDDSSGTISVAEEAVITRAIERAANRMNAALEMRYALAQLAGNAWCRDCNAALAIYLLASRKTTASDAITEQYEQYQTDLERIAAGQMRVPQVIDDRSSAPVVSNFSVDPNRRVATIRRVDDTSTGDVPPSSVKSFHDFE